MSDEPKLPLEGTSADEDDVELPPGALDDDDDPLRALLKKSAAASPEPPAPILPAVQRKLRERSRGKFYGDGWSTTAQTTSYLLVAALMLVVLGLAYYALGPMSLGR